MIEADDLPGVNLSFSPGRNAPLPTKGRSLDHIGFEVKNLEAFVRSLEAQGIKLEVPIRQVPEHQAEDRVPHRSLGHLHRTDRRARAAVSASP